MEIKENPKQPVYRGTLISMLILPSYVQSNSFNKKDLLDQEAFFEENLVIFLYKSNKKLSFAQDYTSAGDNFTISTMKEPG